MKVGIDQIGGYVPHYYLDLETLEAQRQHKQGKLFKDLGQRKMAICPPCEDIVTMAVGASLPLAQPKITNVFFATETSFDQAKAAGLYVHHFVALPSACRVLEFKQACYAGTGAIRLACDYVKAHPDEKVLVVCADQSKYEQRSPAEATQGSAAIAMIIAAHPRLLAIDDVSHTYSQHVMDFWRPYYLEHALVSGEYSVRNYMAVLDKVRIPDVDHTLYHCPFAKMAERTYKKFGCTDQDKIDASLVLNRDIGNAYTASLYMGLLSYIQNRAQDLSGEKLGFFSYGSGCVAEFFTGVLQKDYRSAFTPLILDDRQAISYAEYMMFSSFAYPQDGSCVTVPHYATGALCLKEIRGHQRIYERVSR